MSATTIGRTRHLTEAERTAAIAAAQVELKTHGAANVIATADMLRSKGHDAEVRSQIKKAKRLYDTSHIYRAIAGAEGATR